jgi:hypothetical protein
MKDEDEAINSFFLPHLSSLGLAVLLLITGCLSRPVVAKRGDHFSLSPLLTPVTATIEPRRARIGDLLTLRVVATHEPGRSLTLVAPQFGPFEVRAGPGISRRALTAERQQTVFTFTLAAFATGKLSVPSLKFATDAAGSARLFMSPPLWVEIEPLTTEADTEIKSVVRFRGPRAGGRVVTAFLATLAVAALAYVAARLAQRSRAPTINRPIPRATLEEEAINNIKRLMTVHGSERETFTVGARDDQGFHAELALILRRYCARRYGLPASAQTRTELLSAMKSRAGELVARRFGELLEICELATFARYRFEPRSAHQTARVAIELIGEQAPKGSQI